MAKKKDERTLKMMEKYMELRQSGYSTREIAEQFGLSVGTVYENLSQIAKEAGVSRESLLERVFKADHSGRDYTRVRLISIKEAIGNVSAALKEAEMLQEYIEYVIGEATEVAKQYEGEVL